MNNIYNLPPGLEPHFSRYIKFIESRQKRILFQLEPLERHHILPESMMGENKESNLIYLTLREHFISHLILWKCYGKEMLSAFHLMATVCRRYKIKITSKQYSSLKKEFLNHRKGFRHSETTKKKISELNKKRIYKKGIHFSEEGKKRMSEAHLNSLNINRKRVRCLETNKVYNSLKEASNAASINVSCICGCCKHRQITAGKLHWEYYTD